MINASAAVVSIQVPESSHIPSIGLCFVFVLAVGLMSGSRSATAQKQEPSITPQKLTTEQVARLREAAERGEAQAQFTLGGMYDLGIGSCRTMR